MPSKDSSKAYEFYQIIDKLEREAPEHSREKLDKLGFSLDEVTAFIKTGNPTAELAAILDNLAAHDRSLAERFGDRPIAFDDVARFDDAALLAVYRTAEPEVVLASLLGAPQQLVERFEKLPA